MFRAVGRGLHTHVKACAKADVVIVGGGVTGFSTAYHVALANPDLTTVVVEKDSSYARASSALSAASIRHQFSTALNVQIGQVGSAFLDSAPQLLALDHPSAAPVDVGFVKRGYLFLTEDDQGAAVMRQNIAVQHAEGALSLPLTPDEVSERFPYLETDALTAACLGGEGEGWMDAYSVLMGFKGKALELGVSLASDSVVAMDVSNPQNDQNDQRVTVSSVRLESGDVIDLDEDSGVVVNAAGGSSHVVADMYGCPLATRPHKRCVFVIEIEEGGKWAGHDLASTFPMLIDSSGVWVRPEGKNRFITGVSPPPDRDPVMDVADERTFDVDWSLFDDIIWPALASRAPDLFGAIKVTDAWAGVYNMNPLDCNAILGKDSRTTNVLLGVGFSGHGLMQSPAVGRGLAELVVYGDYQTLDLTPFGVDRMLRSAAAVDPSIEHNVI